MAELTAKAFLSRLESLRSDDMRLAYKKYFPDRWEEFTGVGMGKVFALAKEFVAMPLEEVEKLLESDIHEAKAGACSILEKKTRNKKIIAAERKAMFDLYLRRHDRIDSWDLPDLAAARVLGEFLIDKPRDPLYELARSTNVWERRSGMIATFAFVKLKQIDDALAIAELLVHDPEDTIHKAVGWVLRTVGSVDRERLIEFLEKYASTMPRVMLRYAIEHFSPEARADYLRRKSK